jgi:hypothetical protein
MTDAIKRFGGHERPEVKKFELETMSDDGSTRVHAFQLVPLVPAGHVTALMDALEDEPEKSFGLMAKLMSRLLDNTDGVPARWTFTPDEKGRTFIGPDNEPHPIGDAPQFIEQSAGSSRRRWNWLMNPDNEDEAVHLADMVDIAKWVVSEAIDRPTPARPSSTRGSRKTKR